MSEEQDALSREIIETFGDALFGARTAAGLTQEALAKATGISRVAVAMYETGGCAPSFERACRLLGALPTLDLNAIALDALRQKRVGA